MKKTYRVTIDAPSEIEIQDNQPLSFTAQVLLVPEDGTDESPTTPDDPQPDEPEPADPPSVDPPADPPADRVKKVDPSMAAAKIQAVLDGLKPGDAVEFLPGEYEGQWKLRALGQKPGDAAVTIFGTRGRSILRTNSNNAYGALYVEEKAHNYCIRNLGITSKSGVLAVSLVTVGSYQAADKNLQPQNIWIDNCDVYGDPQIGARRGITFNAGPGSVIQNCAVTAIRADVDSSALGSTNGVGGWIIRNNKLSSAGENILFGGTNSYIPGHTLSDVLIENNVVYKDIAWRKEPKRWTVKNLLEFKRGKNITIRRNVFHTCWAGAHEGFALVFTVRTERRRNPWVVLENILVEDNVIYNVGSGINILGRDYNSNFEGQASNLRFRNNLIVVDSSMGDSQGVQLLTGAKDLTFENNTIVGQAGKQLKFGVLLSSPPNPPPPPSDPQFVATYPIERLTMSKNIIQGPVFGSGLPVGDKPLQIFTRQSDVTGNIFIGPGAPKGNTQAKADEAVDLSTYASKKPGFGSSLKK